MLDLTTIIVLELFTAMLQGVAWLFIWLTWRHLYELKFLGAGFMAIAFGFFLLMLRGSDPPAIHILADNLLLKFGVVLIADGLAQFLAQPRHAWLGRSMMLFTLVFWIVSLAVVPDDVALRIHASTFFSMVMMGFMIVTLWRDRSQPALLRWITIIVLFEYIVASFIHSSFQAWPQLGLATTESVVSNTNAWFFLQGTIFLSMFFACMFFMVGIRLSTDLHRTNDELLRELAERKRLEAQLAVSLDAEKAVLDEQYQFMRMISHEFRTPLAIIQRAGEMMRVLVENPTRGVLQRMDSIDSAIGRLTTLIDRFLVTDRKNADLLHMEDIEIADLLEALHHHFEITGQSERLRISADSLLRHVTGDMDMLLTVMINLIDNALKYSADHETVRLAVAGSDDWVTLTVTDHGIGIPAREQSSLGRRFFRASNVGSTSGTGMGLYNAHRLLSYHGAALELRCADAGGTAAIVRIPAAAAAGPAAGIC